MKTLAKVVVGSRLHQTHREDSDWDYRGIHIHPLGDVLSPFKKLKTTSWIEGDEDNTSYELTEFCKLLTQGNATALEVLFSNQIIETSETHQHMTTYWKKFMHSERFVSASRGYAQNQFKKMLDYSDLGARNQPRTAKFIISFLRVMWQCEQFLLTGRFECSLRDSSLYPYIMSIKELTKDEIDIGAALEQMNNLEKRVSDAYSKSEHLGLRPDIEWIEELIYEAYCSDLLEYKYMYEDLM